MISVITPTHNNDHILETFISLKAQQYGGDWEWVLVPNGGTVLPPQIPLDPRVSIHPAPSGLTNIGALKRFACEKARGDIVVELDHDDILMPNALQEVEQALSGDAVFAYSNAVEFRNGTWEPFTYSEEFGWRYRDFEYQGHALKEAIAFPATPHSLSYIWYAPNHLRAWKAADYWAVGGHDAGMRVIDDHDLMCRLYLRGKFVHIDKPLYLYRVHGQNTWLKLNAEIQQRTHEVYAKYARKLVEVWCDREGYRKLDLGSARGQCPKGLESVDVREGCDVQADLTKPWPFEDSSIGAIIANDFIEHLPDKVHTMNEIHRVLKPGGFLFSSTPSTDGRGAFQDPTHVSYWNENSFWYYTRRELAHYVPEIKARFQVKRLGTHYPSAWHEQNKISYVVADLVALKPGFDRPEKHIPGSIEI